MPYHFSPHVVGFNCSQRSEVQGFSATIRVGGVLRHLRSSDGGALRQAERQEQKKHLLVSEELSNLHKVKEATASLFTKMLNHSNESTFQERCLFQQKAKEQRQSVPWEVGF